jgi:hypothetical protein
MVMLVKVTPVLVEVLVEVEGVEVVEGVKELVAPPQAARIKAANVTVNPL